MAERVFTAAEVQTAVTAVIVYERSRSARLLEQHSALAYSNAAKLRAAARTDKSVHGRYLTLNEMTPSTSKQESS